MTRPLLDVRDLDARYGTSQALFGVSMQVHAHECVTLLGRNGMGKSTLVHAVMGLLTPHGGTVSIAGAPMHGQPSFRIAQAGLGLVPEGRRVFPTLTVRENLLATARHDSRQRAGAPWHLARVFETFPRLQERERHLGAHLSGGEQQMLAIGRALMTNPRLLILDEATEGLAPLVREEIWSCLRTLKTSGLALLVIDKNLAPLLTLADRHYILNKGRIAWAGSSTALAASRSQLDQYLGIAA